MEGALELAAISSLAGLGCMVTLTRTRTRTRTRTLTRTAIGGAPLEHARGGPEPNGGDILAEIYPKTDLRGRLCGGYPEVQGHVSSPNE